MARYTDASSLFGLSGQPLFASRLQGMFTIRLFPTPTMAYDSCRGGIVRGIAIVSSCYTTAKGGAMKCINCDNEAKAICKFCGRAVCDLHIQTKRFATGFTSVGGMLSAADNAFSLEDAVWCGTCHPKYHRSN